MVINITLLRLINLDEECIEFLNSRRPFNLSNFVRTKLHELMDIEKESATNVENQR
jgi:hypothetical protein